MCGYYLRNLPVPKIETWIYIGKNIFEAEDSQDESYYYFEDPDIYFAKEIYEENIDFEDDGPDDASSEQQPPPRLRVADSDLEGLVYDYQELKVSVTKITDGFTALFDRNNCWFAIFSLK